MNIVAIKNIDIVSESGKFVGVGKSPNSFRDEASNNPVAYPISTPTDPLLNIIIRASIVKSRFICLPFKPKVLMIPISFFLSIIEE